jgi:hypothetical protein
MEASPNPETRAVARPTVSAGLGEMVVRAVTTRSGAALRDERDGHEIVAPVPESIRIPSRFNGPLDSGNGGYCSGVVAGFVGAAAEITLRRPVPLDKQLDVVREDGAVSVQDGEAVVAEAHPLTGLDVVVPAPVTPDEARAATARYRGLPDGVFSRCFVCGRARDDAFGVFAGAVDGRQLVASPWTPPSWTADATGNVQPEFVWSVLDCPTYFATYMDQDLAPGVLARLAARIDAPVAAGEEHVVTAWPIEVDGRKRHAGCAVFSRDGEALAVARALLIEPRGGRPSCAGRSSDG